MEKALLVKVSGEKSIVYPKFKKSFVYSELRDFIGGIIQIVPIGKGRQLICHDEGKLINLPKNEAATKIWKDAYPIAEYPDNNNELIVGNILITGRNLEELLLTTR